jgi:hypothetical protein
MERTLIKTCCGGKSYVLVVDLPVSKVNLKIFTDSGYATSETYTKAGVFYVTRNGLTASGPYGGTKFQVRCVGTANCNSLMDHLENTFKMIELPK